MRRGHLTRAPWRSGRPHLTERALAVHPLVWVCPGASDLSSAEAYDRMLSGCRVVVRTTAQAIQLLRALGCPIDEAKLAVFAAKLAPAHFGLPDDDRVLSDAAILEVLEDPGQVESVDRTGPA